MILTKDKKDEGTRNTGEDHSTDGYCAREENHRRGVIPFQFLQTHDGEYHDETGHAGNNMLIIYLFNIF